MSEDYKDILSGDPGEVDPEKLLLYLQGKLTEEQKHEVEMQLQQNAFAEEAAEGLETFRDKEQLQYMVEKLNRDLKKKTATKKRRRDKLRIKDQPWLYISLLILFLLIVLSYIVITRMMKN